MSKFPALPRTKILVAAVPLQDEKYQKIIIMKFLNIHKEASLEHIFTIQVKTGPQLKTGTGSILAGTGSVVAGTGSVV